jgi:hypothetical protein
MHRRVPLYAVMTEDVGVRGAHLVAFNLLRGFLMTSARFTYDLGEVYL